MELEGVNSMQPQTKEQISAQEAQSSPVTGKPDRPGRGWLAAVVIFAVFAGLLVSGILQRMHASAALRTETTAMPVPTIYIVSPQPPAPSQEIVFPANVPPYVSAPLD